MNDIAIKVEHLSKEFKLPHDKASSIKSALINTIKRRRSYDVQHALDNINFEVKKGEFFGIVGKNGGGKSTLLKIISGIYSPTSGNVHVNGKLTPFIELGVGFNPELTGRENVYLNGALLGFNRTEMKAMYKDIVSFAELGAFMEQKLKNYSSGMQVRLAFSIAIRAKSDILVMDEVLAVGDSAFQKKCLEVFRDLKKQKKTIILVTHDMSNVEKFCDRALVIDQGKSLGVNDPGVASSMYAKLNVSKEDLVDDNQADDQPSQADRWGDGDVKIKDVTFKLNDKPTKVLNTGKPMVIDFNLKYALGREQEPIVIGLAFYDENGIVVTGPNSHKHPIVRGANRVSLTLPKLPLAPGAYTLTVAIFDGDSIQTHDYLDRRYHFSVIADHAVSGIFEVNDIDWRSK